jgi:hypothetical protein
MRELIKIIDSVLLESRGLGARRSGEEFVNTSDPKDKIYVNSVTFYPRGKSQFDSEEELTDALAEITMEYPAADVKLISDFRKGELAFGVAVFDRPQSDQLVFIKPFGSVKPDPTQNPWNNQTGIPGYRYNSTVAAKSLAGMAPQDVFSNPNDLTAQDILEQVTAKFGASSPLTLATQQVVSGSGFPIEVPADPALSFSAFRDYFAEILHPIALQTGMYTGNAAKAAEAFLGTEGYADTVINFGADKREGLSDSSLSAPDGRKIRVSSKGPAGATASANNLLDAATELGKVNPRLVRKHADVLDMIRLVSASGAREAPLVLGEKYKIITGADANWIRSLRDQDLTTLDSVRTARISQGLKTLILNRGTREPNNLNMFFHATAAVAHAVADYVNETLNFSQAASEILNNGALVQVYTRARETADTWSIQSFDTVWPSTAVTGVKFSALKTYYSTDIKGNFTFKILRNGAKDFDDMRKDQPELATPAASSEKLPTPKRTDVRPTAALARVKKLSQPDAGPGRSLRK